MIPPVYHEALYLPRINVYNLYLIQHFLSAHLYDIYWMLLLVYHSNHSFFFFFFTEPTFHPHNVSVKPLSDSSLCIQWTLNSTDYLKPLRLANLHLVNFSLTITEARNSSVVIRDTIPINLQRYVLLFRGCSIHNSLAFLYWNSSQI